MAEIRLLESKGPLQPGVTEFARLLLKEPVLLLPGDRFIARVSAPLLTIGGGVVLDIAPPRKAAPARLRKLADGAMEEQVQLLVSETSYGITVDELVSRTGWTSSQIAAASRAGSLALFTQPKDWLAERGKLDQLLALVRRELAEYHRANPLRPGMPKQDLRARTMPDAPGFLLDSLIRSAADVVAEADVVRLASHRLSLREDEETALQKIESAFQAGGLTVPATTEVLASCGVEAARARSLLQILIRRGRLVKVGDSLVYHAAAIEGLKSMLARRKGERFTVIQFKDWTGVSRKYAIPLLEFLDREKVTLRQGDSRLVL
jgi:selenocysteine-specific elongation factor